MVCPGNRKYWKTGGLPLFPESRPPGGGGGGPAADGGLDGFYRDRSRLETHKIYPRGRIDGLMPGVDDAKPLRLSAGNLAAVEGCPRCFWRDRHGQGPPGTPFPGVVQQLDSVIKDYTRRFFGKSNLPPWLPGLSGTLLELRDQSETTDPGSGVTLTGRLDDLLQEPDGGYRIVDYKSGKPGLEKARRYYQHQMDGYAYLAEAGGYRPVKDAVLVFFEPVKGEALDRGQVEFRITPQPLWTNPRRVPALLLQARELLEQPEPPRAGPECEWCGWTRMVGTVGER